MSMNHFSVFFATDQLNYARQALEDLRRSQIYSEYRHELTNVRTLEQRYALAYRYCEILSTEYELEYAIRESIMEIDNYGENL